MQEPNGHRRRSLAVALRDLRKASGLSGERLAERAQLSQSKISRIETGRTIPTVADTERILKALVVPKDVATELLSLARAANVDYASWRSVARLGIWHKQNELKSLANDSAHVRQFLPAIPSGLLQTPEYARETFTPVVEGRPARDVDRAVKARIDSQQCLEDTSRQFWFILTEQALRWRQAAPDVMERQRAHLVAVSRKLNVHLAVLPLDYIDSSVDPEEVKVPALNVFVVYDDRLVTVETFSGEMALRDPRDVSYHLNLFNYFYGLSLHGDDARTRIMQVRD